MSEEKDRPQRWAEFRAGKRWWAIPFIWFEWVCEWIAYGLSRWAFIEILGYVGRLAILVAVVSWVVGTPARMKAAENQRKAKIFQAWQVINSAHGNPGSGGRPQALRDLIDERESLRDVDLSGANLSGANLSDWPSWGADLRRANLSEADLSFTNLQGADLRGGDLRGATLRGVQLEWADLSEADLGNIRDWAAYAGLDLTNLYGVKNPPDGYVEWAINERGAVYIEDRGWWREMVRKALRGDDMNYWVWKKKWDEELAAKVFAEYEAGEK